MKHFILPLFFVALGLALSRDLREIVIVSEQESWTQFTRENARTAPNRGGVGTDRSVARAGPQERENVEVVKFSSALVRVLVDLLGFGICPKA